VLASPLPTQDGGFLGRLKCCLLLWISSGGYISVCNRARPYTLHGMPIHGV
jgi:hypothetical protein